ncbi:MAG: hypothetical protein PHU65_05750 [Actinomycetota bacterium]|jgi:hypothetical protein|nr:hypothetical protein [Actinomycetota bacterium]
MYFGYKKFLILSIIGALIIGCSIYLYLNNHFEKVTVAILQVDIKKGDIINKDHLTDGHFYKQEIPSKVIKNKSELIGLEIKADRYSGDFITKDMLKDRTEDLLIASLKEDEAIMSINLDPKENIANNLKIGKKIMIVSAEKDKDMEDIFYKNNKSSHVSDDNYIVNESNIKNYLDNSVFQISENIFLVDGFVYFKNLEIIYIKENEESDIGILSKNSKSDSSLFVKCKNIEAPYLAKITSSEKYKLLIGPQ